MFVLRSPEKRQKKAPVLNRTPVNSSQALLNYPILCNTWAASNMYRPGCFKFNSTSSLVLQSTFIGDVALSDKYSLKKINKYIYKLINRVILVLFSNISCYQSFLSHHV